MSAHLSNLFKRCLHLGDDHSVIERALEELQRFDTQHLSDYFDHEVQLAPLLFWHLKQRGLTGLLGERLTSEVSHRYHQNIARNFLFERSLQKILLRFNREEIGVLVLKGASAFTSGLCVFRDVFVLFDIDLLVRPSDVDRVKEILFSDGYSMTQSQAMGDAIKWSFLGPDNFTRIDLHSGLFWTGVRLDYHDYFRSDLWKASILDSVAGCPVRILSREDQICYRLIHDTLGHETVLLNNISRLYYLCALVHFYGEQIDWSHLLTHMTKTGSDRMLLAYLYYGKRELGLPLPPELKKFHNRAFNDVAYLDAIAGSSPRLADYAHRTSLALLAADTLQERMKKTLQLLMRNSMMFKKFCLQLAAILYVGAYSLRHSFLGKENAG